jgi:Spy/CpxP family protein refolding chaperone
MTNMLLGIAALLVVACGGLAAAQHQHGNTPYAGMEQRPIKALSEQQVADLRAGRGMGFALAAELNGYPGPSHVLELADQLGLRAEQRQKTQELFGAMQAEAVPVGETLIVREAALDRAFAEQTISSATLASLTAQIGETQGQLRAIHLKYHLTTADLLSPHQRHRYAELRGYR